MSQALADTIASVRERVRPSAREREDLEKTISAILQRTEAALADLDLEADVIRVGSTARDTWLRGDRDIDIFVRFPTDLEDEELERYGIEVGRTVLPDGRLEYAEHPYVTAEFDSYSVDLVPCFRVESATEIRSSVDRTPFHATYIAEAMTDELANEVRVLKRFCEAIGIYGSDLATRGFSGYLTELLVLEYGGFEAVVSAAADWQPPIHLDPADHGHATFDDALVVIDPTDPGRNVAAVVTDTNVARFQHHARDLVAAPTVEKFEPSPRAPLSRETLEAELERRGSWPLAIRFDSPDLVDDQLYPQLRSSRRGLAAALESRGFDVLRSAVFAAEEAVIYFELEVPRRPAVERHEGPPVHVREHASSFLDKWEPADVYGPFIEGSRYVVERERDVATAAEFLRSTAVTRAGHGAAIRRILETGEYEVLVNGDVTRLLPAHAEALASFYEPRP